MKRIGSMAIRVSVLFRHHAAAAPRGCNVQRRWPWTEKPRKVRKARKNERKARTSNCETRNPINLSGHLHFVAFLICRTLFLLFALFFLLFLVFRSTASDAVHCRREVPDPIPSTEKTKNNEKSTNKLSKNRSDWETRKIHLDQEAQENGATTYISLIS